MVVRLAIDADARQACQALTEADHALSRIPAHGTDADFFVGYCRWALGQGRALKPLIHPDSLDELVFTPRYTLLQSVGGAGQGGTEAPHLRLLTSAEIEDRHSALTAAASALRRELDTWVRAGSLIVPDTNVFLQHQDKFDELPWRSLVEGCDDAITVVVPITVLQELDRLKFRGPDDQSRYRAQYSLGRINVLFDGGSVDTESPVMDPTESIRIRVTTNPLGHRPLSSADDEIISHALRIQSHAGRPVLLATFDTNMAFSARHAGLPVAQLPPEALHKKFSRRAPA
jgi:rRNA-processing protein FCF1